VKSRLERWFLSFREAATKSLDYASLFGRFPEADGSQTVHVNLVSF
jgi:hypothetical protein